jgi:multidrug resistance efflux pump
LPEGIGRVSEIYVDVRSAVKAGQPLFKIDDSEQRAALETAKRRIAEVDAQIQQDTIELAAADGRIVEAEAALRQAQDELAVQTTLEEREVVARRAVEKLQLVVDARQGARDAALANKQALESQIETLLPAQKASAEAALAEAQVEIDKTVVYAGVDGTVEQFTLRVGDIVNPLMRPAGVLVPADAGRRGLWAGFGQIEAQVMKVGMVGEVTCVAKPLAVIPMVITEVQEMIAAGQIRPTDQLVDPLQAVQPGTITVFMEPMFAGGFDGIPPGGHCIANAYTSNHDRLDDPGIGMGQWVYLHVIDTVGLVHAMILRVQALLLPVQTLVLGGH